MRDRVDRLRSWLVGAVVLLLLAVGGFLGYAHYRSRAFLAGLPGKLGMDITRETDGYTYSQTVEGRTVFTLHAAKMEQRRDGLVKLHDVGVVVYGRQQDRADRIYGKEFEYDQAAGIVRALGVVNLDLQAPAPAEGKKQRPVSATGGALASTDARVIHVTTSGLVYLTKLGVAATGEEVEFSEGSMTGRAHGADFNSDTGVVVLQSAVRVNGLTASGPMVLTASRAELDRNNQVANLAGAKLVTTAETVEAGQAVVHVRRDGSPERVDGSGKVTILRVEGGVLTAERGEGTLDAAGKPGAARFGGGVRFLEDEGGRKTEGEANDLVVRFDVAGEADHVSMTGGVRMAEREIGTAAKGASRRTLVGNAVEVGLGGVAGRGRRIEVKDAEAVGAARVVAVNDAAPGKKGGPTTTDLTGDDLKARFVGGQRISTLVAVGHTVLHQVDAAGAEERSAGERTELAFGNDGAGPGEVRTATQAGHVEMVRKSMKGQGAGATPVEQRGAAERAEFDSETDRVTMTGSVVLGDAMSTLWAAKVVVERVTGDATAEGGVRVTYLQAVGSGREAEPLHVLADRAVLRRGAAKGADLASFYGSAGKVARLWQGGSQVEAPVLIFDQGARRLTGNGPGAGAQVHAVLAAAGQPTSRGGGAKAGPGKAGGAVRVASHEMVYTDAAQEVAFTGGVLVEDADGTLRAEQATAFLQARNPGSGLGGAVRTAGAVAGSAFPGGNVERIVAVGRVELDQPGRHGSGEELIYTANDGMFVLTGTPGARPRMEDQSRGTITGASLRFHRGDDSVVVTSGGIEDKSGLQGTDGARKRVRTETRVKQQ